MKNRPFAIVRSLFAFWVVTVICATGTVPAAPLGTGYTYQGNLELEGTPVNGTVHLRFSLWDSAGSGAPPTGGNQIGSSQILADVPVANGLFVVLLNAAGQFGTSAFNGDARWLQVEVCTTGTCTSTTVLAPRQPLSPAPYALKVPGVDGHSLDAADGSPVDAVFVGNTGNVGIGNTTPQALLQVGSAYTPTVGGSVARINGLLAANGDLVSDAGNVLSRSPAGVPVAILQADSSSSAGGATWFLASHAANSPFGAAAGSFTLYNGEHRLAIASNGNVGVGTANPVALLHLASPGGSPTLRWQDTSATPATYHIGIAAGDNTFRIAETGVGDRITVAPGTGNVGIGTSSPAARLQVNGTVQVNSSLQVNSAIQANGGIDIPATVRYLSIHPAGFTALNARTRLFEDIYTPGQFEVDGVEVWHTSSFIAAGSTFRFGASVQLPDGAVVTELRALVFDSTPDENITVAMYRSVLSTNATGTMASVSSAGTPDTTQLVDASITNATIDNGTYAYWVRATWISPGDDSGQIRFGPVRIRYQITSPLP